MKEENRGSINFNGRRGRTMRKIQKMILVLALGVTFVGCSNQQEHIEQTEAEEKSATVEQVEAQEKSETVEQAEVEEKSEAVDKTQPVEESTTIVGYIYIEEDQLKVDEVEIITSEDTARIEALGLEESRDYPSGYAIYNSESERTQFELTQNTTYEFTDYKQLYVDKTVETRVYETQKVDEFIKGSSYQAIKLEDRAAKKNYIPYFIEVFDGKVISIKEEFKYTM